MHATTSRIELDPKFVDMSNQNESSFCTIGELWFQHRRVHDCLRKYEISKI